MKRVFLTIIILALPIMAADQWSGSTGAASSAPTLQFEFEARPLFARHTVEFQDRISLTASKTQAELIATAVWRGRLMGRYSVASGFSAEDAATVFGPITVGDTEFTSPRTRSGAQEGRTHGSAPTMAAGMSSATGNDPIVLNLDWTTRPTHRLECSILFDFPVRPVILAEWADHTLDVIDADGKTASERFRRCFVGYGGAIGVSAPWAETELLIAGSGNFTRIEATASTNITRHLALTAGCIWETRRYEETRQRTIAPFAGLAAWW